MKSNSTKGTTAPAKEQQKKVRKSRSDKLPAHLQKRHELTVRVRDEQWIMFRDLCEKENITMSDKLREFIEHEIGSQPADPGSKNSSKKRN